MDMLSKIAAGIPVPEKLILNQAALDDSGKVYMGVGWQFADEVAVGAWVKAKPATPEIAKGLVAVINGLRAQVGAQDDTPGVLTLAEVGETLFGVALGKR